MSAPRPLIPMSLQPLSPEDEFDQAMAAAYPPVNKPARAKYGTASQRLAVRLSEAEYLSYRKLEEGALAFAGVNGTAVVRRALRHYNAHLLSIRHDDTAMAHEVIELRRGTDAA